MSLNSKFEFNNPTASIRKIFTKTDLNKYLTTNYVNLEIAILSLKYRMLNVYN